VPKTGASLAAVIVTVVRTVACNAPPLPCAPALPSSKIHSICTLAGGASLVLP
jgi:hypothetical protein